MEGKRLGGYELRDKLGEGGMGAVYLAHDPTLDRPAAVKVIRAHALTNEGRERFLREARACSRLNHPNIITVYAAGEESGTPYMAMELIDGRTLRDIINKSPVEWRIATRWVVQLLDALRKLHAEGIIHRDLKPENIMVTKDGVIKLMDFGLAHLTTQTAITQEGTTLGTAPYMSPEQVMGKRLDARSDLFSIITIYHEMIVGSHPFRGENPMAVMYSIKHEEPNPLTPSESDFPVGLLAVVARAFEKEPDQRYRDAAALRDAMLAASNGGRVEHDSTRRVLSVLTLVAVVAFVVGLVGWDAYQKRREAAVDRNAAKNLNEMGMAKQSEGDLAGAEEFYRRAIDSDRGYARPYNNLGLLALREGESTVADSLFRLAISLDPRYSAALLNLGDLHLDTQPDSAEAYYRRAMRGDEPAAAGNQLGNLLLQEGRLEEARATLDDALASATKDEVRGALLRNLGKVEAAQGDSLSARAHWQQAAALLPQDPELQRLLSPSQ